MASFLRRRLCDSSARAAALEHVRLMGPPRDHDQVEISRSDEFVLGVDAPVRISGDLANTPGITVEGPSGRPR